MGQVMGALTAAVVSSVVVNATRTALILVQSVVGGKAGKQCTTALGVRFTCVICVGSHFKVMKFQSYLCARKGSWVLVPGGCYVFMLTDLNLRAQ